MKKLLIALLTTGCLSAVAQDFKDLSCKGTFKNGEIFYDLDGNRFEKKIEVNVLFSDKLKIAKVTAKDITRKKEYVFLNQPVMMIDGRENTDGTPSGMTEEYYYTTNELIDLTIQKDGESEGIVAHVKSLNIPSVILPCKNL